MNNLDVAAVSPAQLLQACRSASNRLSFGIVLGQALQHADTAYPIALLRARPKRPRGGRPAEQRDELTSPEVEHGLLPGTRCASLQHAQDAPEAPVGPWGRPESF
jgi:hypothetical protein